MNFEILNLNYLLKIVNFLSRSCYLWGQRLGKKEIGFHYLFFEVGDYLLDGTGL